jgi:methyl-galactoside transport system substrate-binding protein
MKKLISIVLLGLMILSMAACGGNTPTDTKGTTAPAKETTAAPAAQKELNIGVLVWKFDDAYGSTVRTAINKYKDQYEKELGLKINLTMQDANDSMATQNDQADIMFSSKPDFVIINLADVSAGQSLVDKAKSANVPILFYNKEPTSPDVIKGANSIFVGTTPREAGDMQGEILSDLLKKDAKIDKNGDGKIQYIMFEGEPSNPEAIARTKYSVETAEKNGLKLEQLGETLVCNWDQAAAQDAMTAAFASFGEKTEVIFANNDMMGLGAIAALNAVGYNTGKDGDPSITVIGVDAVEFKILIGTNITNQDNIEILFIKNANNNIGAISISSSDESILLNSEFNEKNIKLFSTEYSSRIYQLDTGITPSYNIPFITIDNGDNNYSITLNDSFYYNKVLDVVHNNIFRYKKFIMEYNQIDVKLGDDFKYCINKNNYIIFINGRIIDNKNFEIAIPSCDNPFDQVVAYINIIMSPLDEVEVFYLPFEVTDAYTSASIPTNADISIGSYLPFNLSKNRYWYFINGKKISPNNINNISDNRINIRSDYASIYNFTVMQYMNSIDIISSLLSVNDNWNSIISLLGSDLTLFYDHINFTNTETDIKINETDMKATILEAVAQYYSKYISNTAFIYDFNDIVFDGKDSANNNIINLLNANINNRVDVDR